MPSAVPRKTKKKEPVVVVPPPVVEETRAVEEVVTPAAVVEEAPKKKGKAKKPVKVVAVVTPNGIEGNFTPEPRRPLIVHLQVHPNEILFHDQPIQYDPNPPGQPEPYDASSTNLFNPVQEEIEYGDEEEEAEVKQVNAALFKPIVSNGGPLPTASSTEDPVPTAVSETAPLKPFTRADLMVEYRGCSETKTLPETTDISCFWCVHPFSHRPCVIPEREVGGVYKVYGNFCSPECGMAYLLSETLDPHVRWERMALLQRVYDSDGKGRICPAPPRQSLKAFGGPLTIESYRSTVRAGNVRIDMHMPPMVSILGSIDTKPIDFFDSNLRNSFVGQPTEKIARAEEGLRLKRSKPLKDRGSTLDAVMNIQIRGKKA